MPSGFALPRTKGSCLPSIEWIIRKGVIERLRAYAHLLRSSPELKEKVVLIQIAVPSREGIDTYQDLRTEINRLVGEINGKLGNA